MKIPIQEKIAELEQRIVALEKLAYTGSTVTTSYQRTEISNGFGKHWDNMWKEFSLAMKEVFGRTP